MTGLHHLVSGFTDAEAYELGRPGYPPEAVAPLAGALGLKRGARVVDLGAGTGKLSRGLLAAGFDVMAVEPLAGMREPLIASLGAERVLDARAEAVPLPDGWADAVTAADAFHWFDRGPAIEEIRRLLKPGGAVGIVWSVPAWRGAHPTWYSEIGRLLYGIRPEHPGFDGPPVAESFAAAGGFEPLRSFEVITEQRVTRASLVAYARSISWIGTLPAAERERVLGEVDAVLARAGVDEMVQPTQTDVQVTRRVLD